MSNGQLLVERTLSQTDPVPTVMSASDVDSAMAALSDAYSDVTVALPRAARSLRLSLEAVSLPNVRLGDLRISTSMVRSACYPWYAVCLPISGRIRITRSGESAVVTDRRGAVVSPGQPVSVEYGSDDCEMKTLLFEPVAIERELAALLGHSASSPVDFDLQLPDVAGCSFRTWPAAASGRGRHGVSPRPPARSGRVAEPDGTNDGADDGREPGPSRNRRAPDEPPQQLLR
jgi:AraC-binding-like domain